MTALTEAVPNLTKAQVQKLLSNLHKLPEHKQREVYDVIKELTERKRAEKRRKSLLEFVVHVDPNYKVGAHHKHLAALLEDMAFGRKDRIAVNIAPRFGKSQLTSIYFPAWFIGNFPDKKIMMVSHTADLAVDFGRKVRNLVDSDPYKQVFPDVTLASDSKSAGRWNTNKGGEYFAVGVGGALAGRGGDLIVLDDPHNEQDVLNGNYEVFDKAYDWYTYGLRTRLMPGGRVALVMTRWSAVDLTGRVVQDMVRNPGSDQWEVVEFPAILETKQVDEETGEVTPALKSLWPEQWSIESLLRTKASMPAFQWNAQYMQHPTSAEASIVKKEWWRKWERDDPPDCEYIIMALDAAAEKNNRADYTSLTTWGVFYRDDESGQSQANIILLNAIKERWEFPTLKRRAYEEYKAWNPDWFIIEKKSSGTPLYQEMRAAGVPVQEITPTRGSGDKTARLNSVSDIFAAGMVWYPAGRRWAEDLVDEVCGFPAMPNDDQCLVAGTMILMADGTHTPIERVVAGDLVYTPMGPKPVVASGQTGVKPTVTIRFAGTALTGTGSHPVATMTGWKTLDTITCSDTIKCHLSRSKPWGSLLKPVQLLRRSFSMVTRTIATRMQRLGRTAGTTCEQAGLAYTAPFGSTQMDRPPMGIMSTIKTATGITTHSTILSVCHASSTLKSTATLYSRTQTAKSSLSVYRLFELKPLSGIVAKKVGRGIEALLLRRSDLEAQRTKPKNAPTSGGGKTRLKKFVRSARRRLRLLPIEVSFVLSRVHISSIEKSAESVPVFNLTVADAKCYYANGALVHNCDTTVYALMRFRTGGFIRLPSDRWDDSDFTPRRAAYY